MAALVDLLQRLVRERTHWILAGFAIVAAAAALASLRIHIDTSVERMLIRGDPERELNRARRDEFSNDELMVAAFDLGGPFTAEDLRSIRDLSESIAEVEGVEEVIDISNIEDVRSVSDALDASPLVDYDQLESSIPYLRQRVRGHRLYADNLTSRDGDVLSMTILLELVEGYDLVKGRAIGRILELMEERAAAWRPSAAGYPVIEFDANQLMTRDSVLLTTVALFAIFAVMIVTTRRLFPAVLLGLLIGWAELIAASW